MFATPSAVQYVAPAEAIDVDSKYIVKVKDIADLGVSKFAENPDDPKAPHNLCWTFRMATADRKPVLDVDGNPYELRQYTSNKTGKYQGKTAKARQWIEAFYGRPLEDHEINDGLVDALQGKTAVALFEEYDIERDGQTFKRVRILKLSPDKKAAPATVNPAEARLSDIRKRLDMDEPEPKPARRGSTAVAERDDDQDLPF